MHMHCTIMLASRAWQSFHPFCATITREEHFNSRRWVAARREIKYDTVLGEIT